MKNLILFIFILIRILITIKVIYLLFMTRYDPLNYPIESLTWWIYYLVFDVWISQTMNFPKDIDGDFKND